MSNFIRHDISFKEYYQEKENTDLDAFIASKGIKEIKPEDFKLTKRNVELYDGISFDNYGCSVIILLLISFVGLFLMIPLAEIKFLSEYRFLFSVIGIIGLGFLYSFLFKQIGKLIAVKISSLNRKEFKSQLKRYNSTRSEYWEAKLNAKHEFKILLEKEFNELKQNSSTTFEYWLQMTGHRFEKEIYALLRSKGYSCILTKGSDDKGIDLFIKTSSSSIPIQCKNHRKKISPKDIRDFQGSMSSRNFVSGIFISSMGFSEKAKEQASLMDILLVDLNDIIEFSLSNDGGNLNEYLKVKYL